MLRPNLLCGVAQLRRSPSKRVVLTRNVLVRLQPPRHQDATIGLPKKPETAPKRLRCPVKKSSPVVA
jgi:hypothetical protein